MSRIIQEHNMALLLESCTRIGKVVDKEYTFCPGFKFGKFLYGINYTETGGEMDKDTCDWLMVRGGAGEIGPSQVLGPYMWDALEFSKDKNFGMITTVNEEDDFVVKVMRILDKSARDIDVCFVKYCCKNHPEKVLDIYNLIVANYILRWGKRRIPTEPAEMSVSQAEDILAKVHHYGGPRAEYFHEGEWKQYRERFRVGAGVFMTSKTWFHPIQLLDVWIRQKLEDRCSAWIECDG